MKMTVDPNGDVRFTASGTDIEIDPEIVGHMFAKMSSEEQALFWNGVAATSRNFPAPACFQWSFMFREMEREEYSSGLRVFREMADFLT